MQLSSYSEPHLLNLAHPSPHWGLFVSLRRVAPQCGSQVPQHGIMKVALLGFCSMTSIYIMELMVLEGFFLLPHNFLSFWCCLTN